MPNSLTRTAGLKLGPIALETLLNHYFDRIKKEKEKDGLPFTQLRQDELLYDEAFSIAKRFFDVATHHSVEELQAFSNARTPSPPWVHVVRLTVPMSCCDEAAALLIRALGGEEHTSHLVGGTKWWQVRDVPGVSGEWVTARKDWEEAQKRRKALQKMKAGNSDSQDTENPMPSSNSEPSSVYDKDLNDMCCILFAHGGGYFFGSLDQERYCIQRLARKVKGRVLAINYRLAPQYPFPCALQDLIASYVYLIKPPPDAPHRPLKPSSIVVAGDSAGGGLTLALLQVLRDAGQPLPAGGVLISPWCDLTHSFPSIHTNTATDIMPACGLSLWKPSALWPPPSEETTRRVHTGIRRKIRQIVRVTGTAAGEATAAVPTQDALAKLSLSGEDGESASSDVSDMPIDVGAPASLPSVDENGNQTVSLESKTGEQLRIDSQLQLYTQNSLIAHPLVSPALSYLGGLPPLFIVTGDKEVLRDEIIYSAHKAADPSRFSLRDEARALYPALVGIEERYGPTQVHLQVYDDVAHDLPIIFPFTTPGKYCYRAIATFTKTVTGTLRPGKLTQSSSEMMSSAPHHLVGSPVNENLSSGISIQQVTRSPSSNIVGGSPRIPGDSHDIPARSAPIPDSSTLRPSLSRPAFFSFQRKSIRTSISRSISEQSLERGEKNLLHSRGDRNVRSPSKSWRSLSLTDTPNVCYAGEASVYGNEEGLLSWEGGMIRERVSTQGIIRPLEPADKLDALHVPPAIIGVPSERIMRRYLEGKALFDRKYAKGSSSIEKQRCRNIGLAKKDITKNLAHLRELQNGREPGKQKETSQAFRDGLESSSGAWGWAWADERPPPSSTVCRRDTAESRKLARIADQSILQDETQMNNNSLWAVIVNFLTTSPPKEYPASDSEIVAAPPTKQVVVKKSRSLLVSLRIREKQPKNSS